MPEELDYPNNNRAREVVLIDPATGLPYAASGGGGGGGGAATIADGADVAQGASTDTAASPTIMGRLLKFAAQFPSTLGQKLSAASLGVVIASDQSAVPVSGTVTANVGTGTMPVSGTVAVSGTTTISGAVTNANLDVALSTRLKPADTLTAVTTVGAVTAITNALPAGGNSIGAVTNTNLDVALSTRLKPADTLAAVTTVGAVTAITNALPAGTNAIGVVGLKAQTSATTTMQNAVTANGVGTAVNTDGYNGALQLFISNGAGTATLTIQGSLDSGFTTGQDAVTLGLYKLSDSVAGTNTSRPIVSGALAIAPNTSYLFGIADSFPNIRAVVSAAASLGAGTNVTGLTVKLYQVPV